MTSASLNGTWKRYVDPDWIPWRTYDDPLVNETFEKKLSCAELKKVIERLDMSYEHASIQIDVIIGAMLKLDSVSDWAQIRELLIKKTKLKPGEFNKLVLHWKAGYKTYNDELARRAAAAAAKDAFGDAYNEGAPGGGEDFDAGKNPFGAQTGAGQPDLIAEMNERYFALMIGGKAVVGEFADSSLGGQFLQLTRWDDFKKFRNNVQYKSEGLGTAWTEHLNRRSYEGLGFDPTGPRDLPGDKLNMWLGWGMRPSPGKWKKLCKHIYKVLANGDAESFKYIIRWIAWKLQNPDKRPEVALVFRSDEGAGKGTVFDPLRKMFGSQGRTISNAKHMTGSFNAHLRGVCFLFADESFWAGDHSAQGVLYGMITNPTMLIEPKGIDATEEPNKVGIVMATNKDWIVPATGSSRRFACFDCSNEHAKGHESDAYRKTYFDDLRAEMDGGGFEAFLHNMMLVKLDGWRPRDDVPQTKLLQTQKHLSLPPIDMWWFSLLERGYLPGSSPAAGAAKTLVVHWATEEAAKMHGNRYGDLSDVKIGLYLKKLEYRKHRIGGNGKAEYIVPTLAQARADWVKRVGPHDWGDDFADWGVGGEAQSGNFAPGG